MLVRETEKGECDEPPDAWEGEVAITLRAALVEGAVRVVDTFDARSRVHRAERVRGVAVQVAVDTLMSKKPQATPQQNILGHEKMMGN